MDDYPCLFCDGHHDRKLGLVTCVRTIADRVKEIESKLGAAPVIGSKAQASEATARRQEAGAAPSVSAEYWHHLAEQWDQVIARWETGRNIPASYTRESALRNLMAYRLAAAVTAWYERLRRHDADEADLLELVGAFVRGEPLPQKGG